MFIKDNFFQAILVCFSIIFVLLIIFYPVLFGKKVFFDGDSLFQGYPFLYFLDQAVNRFDHSFLWNQEIVSGFPQYININGIFLYFFSKVVFSWFSLLDIYHWLILISFFLGTLFTYWFVRSLGLSKVASLISAFAYILSQWLFYNGQALVLSSFYFILPLLFLSLLKIKQKKYWYILLAGFGLGIGCLTAHPQFILFILAASFLYALFLDYRYYNKEKSFLSNLSAIRSLIIIFLISLLIGSFQLLFSFSFSHLTARAITSSYQRAAIGTFNPIHLIGYFFPHFSIPYFGWGRGLLYIGFLPLFFALVAFFKHQRDKNTLFFIFLYLFSIITACPYSPTFWLMYHLPGFQFFRNPVRWIYIAVFASAVLAGYGYHIFIKNPQLAKKLINIFKYGIYIAAALFLIANISFSFLKEKVIILLQNYFENNLYQQTTQLPLEYYYGLIKDYTIKAFDNISLINYKFLIPFAFILLGYYLVKIYSQKKISLNKFKYLVISCLTINFLLVYQGYYQFIPKELYLKTPQTVAAIKDRETDFNNFRIFSFMPGFSEYQKLTASYSPSPQDSFIFNSEMITPNLNVLYGLQSIDASEPMIPQRQARLISELGDSHADLDRQSAEKKITLDKKIEEFLSKANLLDMQNVKYVISAYQLPGDRLSLVSKTEATQYKIPIYIYENQQALPRVYFAKQVQFIGIDDIENTNLLFDPKIDFHQLTFIECSECESELAMAEKDNFSKINIEEYQAGRLRLKVETNQENWLIFNENNLPAWQATVDEKITEIYTANYIYQAIKVSAGQHLIEFKYQGVMGYENLFFN